MLVNKRDSPALPTINRKCQPSHPSANVIDSLYPFEEVVDIYSVEYPTWHDGYILPFIYRHTRLCIVTYISLLLPFSLFSVILLYMHPLGSRGPGGG